MDRTILARVIADKFLQLSLQLRLAVSALGKHGE